MSTEGNIYWRAAKLASSQFWIHLVSLSCMDLSQGGKRALLHSTWLAMIDQFPFQHSVESTTTNKTNTLM